MDELKLTLVEEHRGALQTWLPRVAVAVVFGFIGQGKFGAHSSWIQIFDRIGFGQWFRYLTGVLQVGGALLVLIPRTFPIGIFILACTMLGAMAAWIFILGAPFNALIPAVILGGLLIAGGEDTMRLFSRRKPK
jgi:putative oxidoreductase